MYTNRRFRDEWICLCFEVRNPRSGECKFPSSGI
jgi:hypothetical protein